MKTFTDLFIRRPVLSIVVTVVIIIAGLQAWQSLSVRQYPRSENASVTVATVYVGASAEVVPGFITIAIERSIASADGIEYVESKSLLGLSLNYDPTKALADITAKVNHTLNLLTLLAIVLSVGLVVDDAIVMVENVERHLRAGRSAVQAALIGARELIGPIIAMTITLAAEPSRFPASLLSRCLR